MTKRQELDIERMIYLENYIKENENNIMTFNEFIKTISNFTEEERTYIITAKLLPKTDFTEVIAYYDGQKFPIQVDEITFINNLSKKYSIDKNTVIKRIRQVRMINNFEKSSIKAKKRKK